MKRVNLALLLGALLFVSGCLEDVLNTGTGNDDDTTAPLAEATVGTAGGTLTADGFSLQVPAAAFGADADLKLFRDEPGADMASQAASPAFRVEGIPADFTGSLTARVPVSGSGTGESLVAMKTDVFVPSLNHEAATYSFLPAVTDSGTMTCNITATGGTKSAPPGTNGTAAGGYRFNATFFGLSGYTTYTTPAGHFVLYIPDSWMQTNRAEMLGGYLETARDRLAAMGFDLDRRTWPVDACVRSLDAETYGLHEPDIRGDNYARLSFNQDKWSPEEMRTTATHELFHLVQYLYDPRNRFNKAKFSPPHLWLDEACSVWIEELVADNPTSYVSVARAGQEEAPLQGMQKGAETGDAAQHGYGMAAVIHYLVGRQGLGLPLELFQKIEAGESPTRAILEAGPQRSWYGDFLAQYVEGRIYGIGRAMATGWNDGIFRIQSGNDIEMSFSGAYPDLSGKVYMVRLDYAGIDDSSEMNFSLGGAPDSIRVFKFRSSDPDLHPIHGPEAGSLTIPGPEIESLHAGGWHLLVLVSNEEATDPYNGLKPLTLTISLPGSSRIMDILRNTAFLDLKLELPVRMHNTLESGPPSDVDNFKTMSLSTGLYYRQSLSNRDLLSWSGNTFAFHGQDSLLTTDGLTRSRWSADASGEFDPTGTLLRTVAVQFRMEDLIQDVQQVWHFTLGNVPVSEAPDSTYTEPPHGYVRLSTAEGPAVQAYVNEFGWRETRHLGTGWGSTEEATVVQWDSSVWTPRLTGTFAY